MFKKLVLYFIDNSFVVNLISAFLLLVGGYFVFTMKRDLMPPWEQKAIKVNATLRGATAKQVEHFLTYPIEDKIMDISGVDRITSKSTPGSSSVNIYLNDDYKEVEDLVEDVRSRMDSLKMILPKDVEEITVRQQKQTSFWFASISVLNYDYKNETHRTQVKLLADKINQVKGISNVNNQSPVPSVFIQFNSKMLARYRVRQAEVYSKIRSYYRFVPIGRFTKGEKVVNIEIHQNFDDIEDLENLIIKGNSSGKTIRLKDIANVSFRHHKLSYIEMTNGKNATELYAFKDKDGDVIKMKNDLEKVIINFNKENNLGLEAFVSQNGASYIQRQLDALNSNGILGFIIVFAALFLFFGFKNALMTSLGLPLSYMTTFIALAWMGVGIDIISIVGMLLIIGILVDDAIIVSEQYTQYLENGHSPRESAYFAVRKTIVPVTGTVLTTVVAFIPILLNDAGIGKVLRGIPLVVITALAMSWFESFFILPNHLAHFVKNPPKKKEGGGAFLKVKSLYRKSLGQVLRFRYLATVLFVLFSAGTFYLASKKVPFKFSMRAGNKSVRILAILKESSSVENTQKALRPLINLINEIDKKRYSSWSVGIGSAWVNGERYKGEKYAKVRIIFDQEHKTYKEDQEFITKFLQERVPKLKTKEFEELKVDVRMAGHDQAKDSTIGVAVKSKGDIQDSFIISKVKDHLKEIKGIEKVFLDPRYKASTWTFTPNEQILHNYGLSRFDLSNYVRGYVDKSLVERFRKNGELIDVYSFINDSKNLELEDLNSIKISLSNGLKIPLNKLGLWKKENSFAYIDHLNGEKTLNLDINYDEGKTKKEVFMKEVKRELDSLAILYPTISFKVEDADVESRKNKKSISKIVLLCFVLIFMVLALILKSVVQPIIIVMAIPFGLVGVIWAFYFHGYEINIMAMIGILGMAGVVVNDSLILVDTINKMAVTMGQKTKEVILNSSLTRLRPIVLTSVTTLGGVFPMAYAIGGDSGFTKMLALSMGWGLLLATFLTLYLIPALVLILFDFKNFFSNKFFKKGQTSNTSAGCVSHKTDAILDVRT